MDLGVGGLFFCGKTKREGRAWKHLDNLCELEKNNHLYFDQRQNKLEYDKSRLRTQLPSQDLIIRILSMGPLCILPPWFTSKRLDLLMSKP